ncbi:Type 1 glutamine amidotransferase-like domain-containing protein [Aciditerrimonas ferrireducens]|uniref:Type 1 glutamine amidotransferase-like domain-containing protein n=1 Tax=Aciditerrimonas ferrireducens TaxID=667306 RepID=A0ABV6C247_9ACTN|nr:peptidase E [Aciditerrimonas ferrireducens]MCK4176554.1 peptidase E [Aciditerrimonas ferrireducens]
MAAAEPTIVATSGGLLPDPRTFVRPGPLLEHALALAEPRGRPRICFLLTALGDSDLWAARLYAMYQERDVQVSCLALFPMPSVADPEAHLRSQDLIWVGGGSTANLLALWRLHGLDRILRACWEDGVVLGGVSAGSLCWHQGGTTDSFGPELAPITDCLGFLPYSNCPHYDAEAQRRPLFQRLVGEGLLPEGYATDNGAGLVYRGTTLAEVVAEVEGRAAYHVKRQPGGGVQETRLTARLLPGAVGGPEASRG